MSRRPSHSPRRLPGDLDDKARLARMIRVDHAGEYGAVRIYEGQLAILGDDETAPAIEHMAEQERGHRAAFEALIRERRVRPSALLPVWHLAGFALGAGTALLGRETAMACTVAVEDEIDGHYARQIEALGGEEPEIKDLFGRFRAEELEHRDTGLAHGAEQAPAYQALYRAVRAGSRLAIWLSERI